jgi:hypothetical protein
VRGGGSLYCRGADVWGRARGSWRTGGGGGGRGDRVRRARVGFERLVLSSARTRASLVGFCCVGVGVAGHVGGFRWFKRREPA